MKFSKTINVTNLKNVLCQVPRAVVSDWGLEVGDTLELIYKDGEITIKPHIQRGSRLTESSNVVDRTTEAKRYKAHTSLRQI